MTLLVFPIARSLFFSVLVKRNGDTKQTNALAGYGSSIGLELDGMTRMETLDGAPNASQPVLQVLLKIFFFLSTWLVILSYDVGLFKIISLLLRFRLYYLKSVLGSSFSLNFMIDTSTLVNHVIKALDLVEDDWCLGSFMNLEAGSSAQAVLFHAGVLGSPAICGMVWKELGDNIITGIMIVVYTIKSILPSIVWGLIRYRCQMIYARYNDCCLSLAGYGSSNDLELDGMTSIEMMMMMAGNKRISILKNDRRNV
ncbi:uncharacterized protein BX664DRAFT_386276 [Halteromyces radiatus]|uniref:uncharacterized protein n=1 Tax=Halteromyces radiatus TaxID=101107 RepID=UPI00221F9150|nr:uncharacterized protein BX664DRAFT_386276 [Halteromyces radiatus]KAI8089861.1 hypothetical protein BX664DRAFT_386276 [Halteromyces radiatus]